MQQPAALKSVMCISKQPKSNISFTTDGPLKDQKMARIKKKIYVYKWELHRGSQLPQLATL